MIRIQRTTIGTRLVEVTVTYLLSKVNGSRSKILQSKTAKLKV